jgi:5-methyltetrahydropteroyltriglutamate--homocysteine methyltransferase
MKYTAFNLTYVGSFPLKKTKGNIVRCTEDLLSIPVDYPNYVQLEDMGHQFLRPLAQAGLGLKRDGERYWLTGELQKPIKSPHNESLEILLRLSNDDRFKKRIRGVKACVTGPFTLASRVLLNKPRPGPFGETALADPDVIERLAEIVAGIATNYRQMGVDYIVWDEPILSVIVGRRLLISGLSNDRIVETFNKAVGHIDCLKGIHVCGTISRRLAEILLASKVDVLDHEFKDSERNFDVYLKKDFELYKKRIGLSASSSQALYVESVEEMIFLLKRGIQRFGKENILMVKPDCGFRGLDPEGNLEGIAYSAAICKLRNLRRAIDSLNQ